MPPCTKSTWSFFKVILSSTLHNGKLKIPTKFVKDRGDELAECVSLSVPSGRSWNVGIQRDSDGPIWFHDGLLKLMEDNSIGIGFFLIFKYRGGSNFSVLIFDLTATEIQYNCTNASATSDVNQIRNADIREASGDSQNAEDSDDSIECLDLSAEPSKSVDNTKRSYFTRRKKRMLDRGIGVNGINVCFTPQPRDMCSQPNRILNKTHDSNKDKRKKYECGKSSLKYKDKNVIDGSSTSPRDCADERTIPAENMDFPTSFKVTIKAYNIEKRYLAVPNSFARRNMPHSTQLIKLLDSVNKEWEVRFTCNRNFNLTEGWRIFVKDKKLMAGDVCIFELIEGKPVKLRVHIYPSADDKTSKKYTDAAKFDGCDASPSDFAKAKTIEADNKLQLNSFVVTLTPININNYFLNVPSNFVPLPVSYDSTALIKLVDVENKEWDVRYIHRPGNHSLSEGWIHFVRDKKLMAEDVCTFERVWGDELKLKVTISKRVK